MNPPASDPTPPAQSAKRRSSGRLRTSSFSTTPRSSRKTTKFRCRNCGQRVLVDRMLRRRAITCPNCQEVVPAPQPQRLWFEIAAGIVLFITGWTVGHQSPAPTPLPVTTTAILLPEGQKKPNATRTGSPKPSWFSDQSDASP